MEVAKLVQLLAMEGVVIDQCKKLSLEKEEEEGFENDQEESDQRTETNYGC